MESTQLFDEKDLMVAVWKMVYQLFGEYGASQTSLSLIECDKKNKVMVVRCSHKALDMVRASVSAVTEIDRIQVAIHIIAVSGTLKALRKKLNAIIEAASIERFRDS